MFRRRRLVALIVVLLVVAGIVLVVWQPWRGVSAPTAPTLAPSESPTTPAATTTAPAPVDTPTAEPTPAPTETGIAACSTSDITVLAATDLDSYGPGEQPKLSMTVSNDSAAPCLMNVGTATQQFEITSGSDTWWRSTDCQSESSDQVVQLEPGQTVSSVSPLVWDRTRSSVDTCGGARPAALPGFYHLSVSIGGITAADTKGFELR